MGRSNPRSVGYNSRGAEEMSRVIGSVLCILLAYGAADGTCYPVVAYQSPVYAAPAVYATPVNVYVQPAIVPLYIASYGAPESAALLEEIRLLRKEVSSLRGGGSKMPPAQPDSPSDGDGPVQVPVTASLAVTHCASCHGDSAKAKGGGHVFFKDGKAVFGPEQLGAAIGEVSTGRMPKGRVIPDAERLKLVKELVGAK